jgi:glycosyltransferase involved in cell wall biosynthesis
MSSGLPVIVTDRTAPKEFTDPSCGILVDPDNMDDIEKAMKKMINTHRQYDHRAIREKIVTRFGFEHFGRKMSEIYSKFAGSHGE